jgi:hypothetical protein
VATCAGSCYICYTVDACTYRGIGIDTEEDMEGSCQMPRIRFRPLPLFVLSLVILATSGFSGGPVQPDLGKAAEEETGPTFTIFAHRLGLVGNTTANGHVVQENDRFATLPCYCSLSSLGGDEFQVRITYGDRSVVLPVWDVGPWNVTDNFWDPPEEREWPGLPQGLPQAQAAYQDGYNDGLDGWGREVRTPAGMDIADGAFWHDLGMTGSDWVEVTFLWVEDPWQEPDDLPESLPADIPILRAIDRPPLDPVEPIDDSDYFYIVQTGHNMHADIWDYWHAHGGWRFFGLPISELYVEYQRDGSWQLLQLFERSILEYNPFSPDRPLVQGRLVGYSADAPDLAREPIAPFESTERSWYFPETGHSLSNGFLDEWIFRGGLEVFGYPITEEFGATSLDGRPYVAQVFERARFEWWPDRVGTDEEITYGLLVVEMQRELGFLPEEGRE